MKHKIHSIIFILINLLSSSIFLSCSNDDGPRIANQNYFPLKEGMHWTYLSQYIGTWDSTVYHSHIEKVKIKGDTLVDSHLFKMLVDSDGKLIKIIREEKGKYYSKEFDQYSKNFKREVCFLDVSTNENEDWDYSPHQNQKITARIIRRNFSKEINEVKYDNLIEVQVNYYNNGNNAEDKIFWLSTNHTYSKDIGEIESYFPYPSSYIYSDIYNSLISYSN